jgi:hypothetical protein
MHLTWTGSASARDTDFPSNTEGYFHWIIVHEGDTWEDPKEYLQRISRPFNRQ